MKARFLLAVWLLFGGWGDAPSGDVVVGKAWGARECHSCWPVGEWECVPLPEPVCFDDRYWLYTNPYPLLVDEETWKGKDLVAGVMQPPVPP